MSATLIERPNHAPAVLPFVGVAGAPDEWLVRMVARGDSRAFEQIVLRYSDPLHRFCRGITGHAQDAEEALQTTMLRAYQALSTLERPVVLRPWLFRVARNVCIDIIRGRPDWATLTAGAEPTGDDPGDGHELRERMRDLRRDLMNLDEPHRSALLLRELNGLSHKEIGDTLNTSPESAKRLIFEARETLLERNAGRDLDCAAVRECISGQDGRTLRSRRMRTHLDECAACAAFRDGLRERPNRLAALFPALPAAGLARLWKGLAGHGVITAGREAALVAGGGSGLLAGAGTQSAVMLGALAVTGVIALPGMVASGDVQHGVTPVASTMTLAGAPHHPPALPPVRRTTPVAQRTTPARPVRARTVVVVTASAAVPRHSAPAPAPTVRVHTAPRSRHSAPRATRVVVSSRHGRSVVPPRAITPQAMSTPVDPPVAGPQPTMVASAATAAAPVTTQPAPPVVATPPDGTVTSTPQGGGATAAGSPPTRPVPGGSGQPGTPQTPTPPGNPKTTGPPPTKPGAGDGGAKGGDPPQKREDGGGDCSGHHHRDHGDD
ncbi:MAG: sigma-70 family RNA polymerase sigma factor [Thermoleophilia bacterium]